jgi:hypothetical protein
MKSNERASGRRHGSEADLLRYEQTCGIEFLFLVVARFLAGLPSPSILRSFHVSTSSPEPPTLFWRPGHRSCLSLSPLSESWCFLRGTDLGIFQSGHLPLLMVQQKPSSVRPASMFMGTCIATITFPG